METQIEQYSRIAPISLSVDYLLPGFGKWFIANGDNLGVYNRVVSTRIELNNERKEQIAVGKGSCIVA